MYPGSIFSHQAFSAPFFDVDRLIALAEARLAQSTDHLWLLQTDPVYFQLFVKNFLQGKVFRGKDSSRLRGEMAILIATIPNEEFGCWTSVVEELKHIRTMYQEHRDTIKMGATVPLDFGYAIGATELVVSGFLEHIFAGGLRLSLMRSSHFEDYYTFIYGPKGVTAQRTRQVGDGHVFYDDPLFWCVNALSEPDKPSPNVNGYDKGMLFSFLEDWLASETTTSEQKSRLEQSLLSDLSDLSAIHEILAAIRQHRPGCEPLTAEKALSLKFDRTYWRKHPQDVPEKDPKDSKEAERLLQIVQAEQFPTGKKDVVWFERANRVRGNVDLFWDHFRGIYTKYLDGIPRLTEADRKLVVGILSFSSDPAYLAFLEAERESILVPKDTKYVVVSTGDDSLSYGTTVTSTFQLPSRPNPKINSCPDVASSGQDITKLPDATQTDPIEPAIPKLIVRPESLLVFQRMFPLTPEEYAAKPLDWRNFVRALEDAGFSAEKSGGSAVTFAKEGKGRIIVHKPHPVAKVDQIMLQSWGKRMNKWFEWERKLFVGVKEVKEIEA